ncbi:hypothetical protein FKP32DRAFT_1663497 [Trametes sanguinea]|nr:hypothetical protein FKP32DRAFT_1663497 [Trametes sanguinea]
MSKGDDTIPDGYGYEWTPSSQLPLQDFLAKYKPSMVQNDGTRPWLWVRKSDTFPENKGVEEAIKEASALLSETTERVEKIQNDPSIPIRANKKKGTKSKKELREEAQHEATGKLKEISQKHGFVSGKWLIFAPPDRVDAVWSAIATSLVSGPLSTTAAYAAKVATSPPNDTPNYNHLLCVYLPDVYNRDSVTEVMKVLLRNHGMNLMGVKSNLYTEIGIDSKHPSGIPSTVWKNTALMKETEIKALKDEYFAELNATKSAAAEDAAAKKSAAGEAKKPKPKLKKKVDDNPFGSDDEEKEKDEGKKPPSSSAPAKGKGRKPVPKRKAAANDFASDDEAEAEQSSKAKKSAPKKRSNADDEDSEEDAPKRKKGRV